MKKKICSRCNLEKPIWKSLGREKLCQLCWNKEKPTIPKTKVISTINKFSTKKIEELKLYRVKRDKYMKAHTLCEAKISPNCSSISNDLHHKGKRGKNLANENTFIAVCRACHNYIHEKLSTEEAILLGLLIKE